jgi:hypothetical protein
MRMNPVTQSTAAKPTKDSSMRAAGIPVDVDLTKNVCCVRCGWPVFKGTLGAGTAIQVVCRRGCKGEDGKPFKFPIIVV